MFRGQKINDEIREKIELALDSVFMDYQTKYNMSGDIEPLQALAFDESVNNLTDIVCDILQFEYDYFRG